MRSMYETASIGYSPVAVSAESMIADVPSSTAFATSLASARVGSGWWIIDSSICVAVITGFPRSRPRRMIRFWSNGTVAGPISTPRSPRATISAQVADVGRGADERQRDEVDAEVQRELQVLGVLARQRRDRDRHAGQVHALVRRDRPADDDRAVRLAALDVVHEQAHMAVVDEHLVPGLEHFRDHGRLDGEDAVAGHVAAGDRDLVAALEPDRLVELPDAELRPLE